MQRVNLLASNSNAEAAEPFLAAFRALQFGEAAALAWLPERKPRLARERGTNGNTLLSGAAKAEGEALSFALIRFRGPLACSVVKDIGRKTATSGLVCKPEVQDLLVEFTPLLRRSAFRIGKIQ